MPETMIIDVVRTAIGRRNGGLSTTHPANLLALVLREVVTRAGIAPEAVGQVIAGCVSQVGEQSVNIARTSWLTAGLPEAVAATTIDAQCGSSQQATALTAALIGAGTVELGIGCGVESMSRVPIGSNMREELQLGTPIPAEYEQHFEFTSQFEASERIADAWGVTRDEADAFGFRSQQRAQAAWSDGRFDRQIVPVRVTNDADAVTLVSRDEGLRETSLEALAKLRPVARPDGVHTAGSSSQISDGAAAVLLASRKRADQLGLSPRAVIRDSVLVASDPELMLTGPIPATRAILERNGLAIGDIDVVEVNEAFASVVLAWQRELGAEPDRVNPNGGAIALGHPLGATGVVLISKLLAELERTDARLGLVTMCCGGGLGTGMLIERV
jgi:acetyl-CoA C-acetyltransferase